MVLEQRRVRARDVINWPREEFFDWAQPNDRVWVELDDGPFEIRARRLFFSYMHWGLHRMYPNTPLTKANIIDRRKFTSGSSLGLMSTVVKQCSLSNPHENREVLWKALFDMYNDVYNFFTHNCEEYVTTIAATDFYQITMHPEIKKVLKAASPTRESVKETYERLRIILTTDPYLHSNPVARAVRTEHVSIGQVLQCVGVRGFLTDINSEIFQHPVMRSYATGLISLPDSLRESRSAAKSLLFNKEQIKQSEYFSRQIQIASAVVQRLHVTDCGTKVTVPMQIHDYKDLVAFQGRFINTEAGLVPITTDQEHLIGTTVQMRSVCFCDHEDDAGICTTCYGLLSNNFALTDNIGDLAARNAGQQITQNILSTKHHDGSSTVETNPIPEDYFDLIRYGPSQNEIKLAAGCKGKQVKIKMKLDHINMLYDIAESDDISVLIPSRLFSVDVADFEVYDPKTDSYRLSKVNFGFSGRPVVPSKVFIRYLKVHSWDVTEDGWVIFDLSKWDVSRTLFQMPLIHRNMLEYAKEIEREFKFSAGSMSSRKLSEEEATPEDVGEVLTIWHRLCAQRLRVNIAHLDVMLHASMIRSPHANDYRTPSKGTTRFFSTFGKNMNLRTLSMKLAYEEQLDAFQNACSYVQALKPDHPLDYIFLPRNTPKPGDEITKWHTRNSTSTHMA